MPGWVISLSELRRFQELVIEMFCEALSSFLHLTSPRITRPYRNTLDPLHNKKQKAVKLEMAKRIKHTTGGIPRWSPTLVLVARFSAYVWQSGRDARFPLAGNLEPCFLPTVNPHMFAEV
jgi:hypothetical protein